MISLKQINKKVVKAIPIPNEDTRPIKGYDICPEVYANIFLCAKKKSGKTSALFKILKECADKKTVVIVFCSTVYKDKNWIQIRKYFERKGRDIRIFTSLKEDGEDQLNKLIEDLNEEARINDEEAEDEDEEPDPETRCDNILDRLAEMQPQIKCDEVDEEEKASKRKPRKSKYLAPEYIIVFDDLSSELKSKSLFTLMKKNRHYKAKLIISSQWLHDLLPESRKQLDLFLIFKGFPKEKLEKMYSDCDSGIPFDLFYEIYKKATKVKHSFMYVDTTSDTFRCNFNHQFIINHDDSDNDEETPNK